MADEISAIFARSDWVGALLELAVACAEGDPSDASSCLRAMNALLLRAPESVLLSGLQPLGPARIEMLLEACAHETGIMAMLDNGAGYMVSRGGDGQSLATVALPGALHDESGSGATPALALIGALALSLSSAATTRAVAARRSALGARAALH